MVMDQWSSYYAIYNVAVLIYIIIVNRNVQEFKWRIN